MQFTEGREKEEMSLDLKPVELKEEELFAYTDGESKAEQFCIGHLRGYFSNNGKTLQTSWFEHSAGRLNDEKFKGVFNDLMDNYLYELLHSRAEMLNYCVARPESRNRHCYTQSCWCFRHLTEDYAFYIRCTPVEGDYNLYVYAYDKEPLFRHLAQEHGMPVRSYSNLPSTGEPIIITFGQRGYTVLPKKWIDRERNERYSESVNMEMGVTKAQAEAMKVGSMFGWRVPGADPKNYNDNGEPKRNKQDREER